MNTAAILALATEALRLVNTYGFPAAESFIALLAAKPEPTLEDLLAALRRSHVSADEYIARARAELNAAQVPKA